MADPDPYKTLGIPRDASSEDVGRAFKRAAAEVHPDRRPNDPAAEARFKELSGAYHLLIDPAARSKYDARHPPPSADPPRKGYDYNSILDEILGAQRSRAAGPRHGKPREEDPFVPPQRGTDANATIDVSFDEAMSGCRKEVRVRVSRAADKCGACGGDGSTPGTRRAGCTSCAGHGRNVDFGAGMSVKSCRVCRGRGTVPLNPCRACRGTGKSELVRTITVTVPKGVKSGDTLRVAGMGGPGSPPGDLFLEVQVAPDPRYERDGADLRVRRKVTMKKAIVGGTVAVDLPNGRTVEVEIPPGSQPGDEVRLESAVPMGPGGTRMNLVLVIEVALPKKLSERGRKLLDELVEELSLTEV